MKNRKRIISTLVGLSLTYQMLPSTYTIVANAQTLNNQAGIEVPKVTEQTKNGLRDSSITLAGNGCTEGIHRFKITFDTEKRKLKVKVMRGVGNGTTHPFHEHYGNQEYITIQLLNSYGDKKEEFTLKGKDNITLLQNALDKWDFEIGDRLRVKTKEADWRVKIDGLIDETGNSITEYNGPKDEDIEKEKTDKDKDEIFKKVGRTPESVLNNYDFVITEKGLQQKKVTEQAKNGLRDSSITLGGNGCYENPGAGIHKVEIKFNTEDMKLSATALSGYEGTTHSFHEYCPGEYITIQLLDKNGVIKKGFAMSGKDNIAKLTKELNTWNFNYGYSLRIFHGEAMQRTIIEGPVLDKEGHVIQTDYATTGVTKNDLNMYKFEIRENGLKRVDQNIIAVESKNDLIDKLEELKQSKKQATIKLTKSIQFDASDIDKLKELSNNKSELTIPEGVTLIGDNSSNKVVINLNNQASLVLKGNYTSLENIDIKNSNSSGIQIYDSKYSSLKKVCVEDSNGYGIYANGSTIAMQDCQTSKNKQGGILISTSLDLELRKNKNSTVTFKTNTNKFNEDNKVVVKDLQLVNKCNNKEITNMQNNTFKVENNKMGTDKQSYQYDPVKNYINKPVLSQTYKEILERHKEKLEKDGISIDDIQIKEDFKYYNI